MAKPKKIASNYFTQETQDYIIKYNESTDIEYKNKIFTEHIYYPFYKLAENLIHTFKFYYTDTDTIEDLKFEIISMLVKDKIHKFNPENGAKAYSYFGTIVKRWLINYSNKNYAKLKQVGSFTDVEESYEQEKDLDEASYITLSDYFDIWIEDCYNNLESDFEKESDRQVADAILTVFKDRKSLDIFKKKALYIYFREITGSDTPQLTKVVNILKARFYNKYYDLLDQGLLSV